MIEQARARPASRRSLQNRRDHASRVRILPEFTQVNACEFHDSVNCASPVRTGDSPCHVPSASLPSVIGSVTVGPIIDVFVCDTLWRRAQTELGRRARAHVRVAARDIVVSRDGWNKRAGVDAYSGPSSVCNHFRLSGTIVSSAMLMSVRRQGQQTTGLPPRELRTFADVWPMSSLR